MFLKQVKNKYKGQAAYIIAKGESLSFLTKNMIGTGVVITLNQAIQKVEALNLPNPIISMQKDRIVSAVSKSVTLLLQTGYSADEGKERKIKYQEFANEDLGLRHDMFSAVSAIELARWMGCVKLYLISFDSCVTGSLETFDGTKPYFETAYISQKHQMKPYLEKIEHEFIIPDKDPIIALITPTGGRPKQMELCAKWMKAQTYSGKVLWVIVDDCEPKTTDFIKSDFKKNWTIKHVHPTPIWKEGDNTQSRNLKCGLDAISRNNVSAIFIIEDDDYYKPAYLEYMTVMMKGADVCGEIQTLYYNVRLMISKRCLNVRHCSLFQTAFTPKMVPLFKQVLDRNVKFIDIEFFKLATNVYTFKGLDLAVGIKGIPGRDGIGSGHQQDIYHPMQSKQKMEQRLFELKQAIGDDYIEYVNLHLFEGK